MWQSFQGLVPRKLYCQFNCRLLNRRWKNNESSPNRDRVDKIIMIDNNDLIAKLHFDETLWPG